ncbi:YbaB/EbfC family nucleoid-associated protein [Candidatus Falkowbacteria bacterium]|nr:YbaB/EbfC family nucleoid-associated protein [Candidatus Falkowbacteria bacterium]
MRKTMFNKLKHLKDLRSQAKTMQNALAQETVTVEKGGITVVMNGNMEITSININEDLAKDSLEGMLTESINEAIKKTQRLMARKMQELGNIPGF